MILAIHLRQLFVRFNPDRNNPQNLTVTFLSEQFRSSFVFCLFLG
ncbi:hypothetical protein HanRHA438_Chr08g0368751 [Helianthus annuus]|nr:hypothetical protein HanHA300_Chr08g0294531 [Helianthus annuus]KAJ0548535.1 hypothetical protein HanIR_Chr08g0384901 [Helianthus annuus]KAJ0554857.1 hypothetical protein HanHA89_Chr08g0313061 [Helianthus annuus]KAJ0720419.1 hypothetical protein HanLR1_Chr08g0293351 [Helianthus annuus]KAJ0723624.1 hypothetical protein HanOQP8_Chr08g0300591 [Helianthus annuus]